MRNARPRADHCRLRTVRCGAVAAALLLGACGASGADTAKPAAEAAPEVAGPDPSASSRMICADEAKEDIAGGIGVDTVQPLDPSWADHVYSCTYTYSDGAKLGLSVKELSSAAETTAYFDTLGKKLGRGPALEGLGEDAYQTTGGSAVVRKDYRVLLVDTSGLPDGFGPRSIARAEIAAGVAGTIMSCWVGG